MSSESLESNLKKNLVTVDPRCVGGGGAALQRASGPIPGGSGRCATGQALGDHPQQAPASGVRADASCLRKALSNPSRLLKVLSKYYPLPML